MSASFVTHGLLPWSNGVVLDFNAGVPESGLLGVMRPISAGDRIGLVAKVGIVEGGLPDQVEAYVQCAQACCVFFKAGGTDFRFIPELTDLGDNTLRMEPAAVTEARQKVREAFDNIVKHDAARDAKITHTMMDDVNKTIYLWRNEARILTRMMKFAQMLNLTRPPGPAKSAWVLGRSPNTLRCRLPAASSRTHPPRTVKVEAGDTHAPRQSPHRIQGGAGKGAATSHHQRHP